MNTKSTIISYLFALIAGIAIGLLLCSQCSEKQKGIVVTKEKIDSVLKIKEIPGDSVFVPTLITETVYKPVYIETSSTFDYVDVAESQTYTDDYRAESSTFSAYRFTGYLSDSLSDFTEYPVNFIGTNLFMAPPYKSSIDTVIMGHTLKLGFLYPELVIDSLTLITKPDTLHYSEFTRTVFYYEKPWYMETWFEITKDLIIAATFSYIGTQVK